LVGADRVVTISEFTRTFVFAIYAYRSGQSLVTTLGAAVMGAALGFLLWNFKPAKIFMGDAGRCCLWLTVGMLFRLPRLLADKQRDENHSLPAIIGH